MSPAEQGHARAFGLQVEADHPIVGLRAVAPTGPERRRVTVSTVPPAALAEVEVDPEPVVNEPGILIEHGSDAGYLFTAEGYGRHLLSPAGDRVYCSPPEGEPTRSWQRFLTGQLLPFAATLQGLELMHASAVVIDGTALALVGGSGAGKTSLAAALAGHGAGWLTDDALAIEPQGGALVAHPGPAVANVRRPDGETDRVEIAAQAGPARLGTVCFVQRSDEVRDTEIERQAPVEPRMLLASTFNLLVRTRERLAAQLDVYGLLADSCLVLVARAPRATPAESLARSIRDVALARTPG